VTRAGQTRELVTTGSPKKIHKEARMGSMLKADSERRELVRERRQARMGRKQERRDARERKRARMSAPAAAPSAIQRAAQERVEVELDRIVSDALQRHDRDTATANMPLLAGAGAATRVIDERPAGGPNAERARVPAGSRSASGSAGHLVRTETAPVAVDGERTSRRERDIAAFRERRRQTADEARAEARERIARAGEPASVADALAALAHPGASAWDAERQELERALQSGRIVEVGAVAPRSLWAMSRDAARSSRRARRDPDLALAACVAYAIIARLPRSAVRSAHRTVPSVPARAGRHRAFWR
jgi:hypothetical protein